MPSFKRTRIDRDAESNGVWRDYKRIPGVRLRIARFGNPKHRALLTRLTKARLVEVQAFSAARQRAAEEGEGDIREDRGVMREINAEAAAREVLLDWEGVTEDDTEGASPVPYSWEVGYEYLMDVELPFFDDVLELSMQEAQYLKTATEGALGN
jgi:hypothetical protein